MKRILPLIILFITFTAITHTQVLTNAGAVVHVKEEALLYVSGDTKIKSGEIRVYDKATVKFDGTVDVDRGGLYLLQDAVATITGDLRIAVTGICWRYSPGSLFVYGTVDNRGELNNEGEIVIGRSGP